MLNAGLVESERKKEMGRGACARALVYVCVHVHLPMGEGMLRFVGIVKAPQVSCAHIYRHCVSLIKEARAYSTHVSERRCARVHSLHLAQQIKKYKC